jgi:CheY-like chemotaxis protein
MTLLMTEQDPHAAANILIADDQPDVLKALRLLCKPDRYRVQTAASPTAVIDAVSKTDFDLVLMDLNYARGHGTLGIASGQLPGQGGAAPTAVSF